MPTEHIEDREDLINRMVGEELRRAREAAGLTRAQLIERMTSAIHPQTLASYENGIRQCSIPRLEELSRALRVDAPELLAIAFQRAYADPLARTLRVDLLTLTKDISEIFVLVRNWARNRLEDLPDEPPVARLEPATLREMAYMANVPLLDLINYLIAFTPTVTPRG